MFFVETDAPGHGVLGVLMEAGNPVLEVWGVFPETERPALEVRDRFVKVELAPLGARGVDGGRASRKIRHFHPAVSISTFLRVSRVAESLFHFAGMHELAKRVRPSTRRPGRRLADEGSETESDTA